MIILCSTNKQYHKTKQNTTKILYKNGGGNLDKLYTCPDIAKRYGVELNTVWSWVRTKQLPASKIGHSYYVTESDLLAFEQSKRTTKEA
jgi:uncharacterized protein YjcR